MSNLDLPASLMRVLGLQEEAEALSETPQGFRENMQIMKDGWLIASFIKCNLIVSG